MNGRLLVSGMVSFSDALTLRKGGDRVPAGRGEPEEIG
jgi:hypothetical protein